MSSKNNKAREERAQRAAAMRQQRESADKRRRNIITGVIVLVVVAIVVGAVVAIQNQRDKVAADADGPAGITSDNGFLFTAADASSVSSTQSPGTQNLGEPIPVVLYEDFQCPVCKNFETAVGPYLGQQTGIGAITVEYRPIAFLNRFSTTDYSTRSANAAACVYADKGTATFLQFHNLLYENQPAENSSGLPDDQLTELAKSAGASGDVSGCISNSVYDGWVDVATEDANKAGVAGTPTVLVAGEPVSGPDGPDTVPDLRSVLMAIANARAQEQPGTSTPTS